MIVAYVLALSKHLPQFHDRQRRHVYRGDEADARLPNLIIDGMTALILGTGNVGAETARKLKTAFRMTTIGINSDGRPVEHFDETYTLVGLDAVLRRADFVIATSVLVEATRNVMSRARIALMKPSAFLINPSRGGLIDEPALIEALRGGPNRRRGA